MILRAVSDSTPPPDLTVSLTLNGGNLLEPITLEREAEHPSPPLDSTRPQARHIVGQVHLHMHDKVVLTEPSVLRLWTKTCMLCK